MKIDLIASYAQLSGSLIIALLGLLYFSKRDKPALLLGIYGVNSVVFQIAIYIFIFLDIKGYNNVSGNLYTLLETIIILFFFNSLFSNKMAKRFTLLLCALYVILFFAFIYRHWFDFISSIRTMRDLMIIICTLLYFYYMITNMPTSQITKYPMFWIMSAFLVYFAGTFVLSLSLDFLVNVLKDDLAWLWTARNFFRFFFCLLVSYGLWMDLRLVKAKTVLNK